MGRRERLTPELADTISAAVRAGRAPHLAASAYGVPKSTFYDWMRWGQQGRRPYSEFSEQVRRAQSESNRTNATKRRSALSPQVLATSSGRVFVGRDAEMSRLKIGLEEARSGRGQLFMLVGEPGIGKTRTAEELLGYARQERMRVLTGRCHEGDGAPAFWPWVQVIRSYTQDRAPNALLSELGSSAADLALVVPELRHRFPNLPVIPGLEAEQARFRLFDSVTTFLKRAARRQPLVLLLDDLHWADKPSLLLLQFLGREMAETRLFVVGTYRDVEVDRAHPLAAVVDELRREAHFELIFLRGLARHDVRALIAGIGGHDIPEAFVDTMFRRTEGNPFFLEEILRHLAEEGIIYRAGERWTSRCAPDQMGIPEGVRAVICRRLTRLSEGCNRVLAVAAVIGRDFPVAALQRLCAGASRGSGTDRALTDLSADQVLAALEEARRARVITFSESDAGRCRFSHALIRETLYEQLSGSDRAWLHDQVANVLEELYRAKRCPHLAAMAYHFFEGSPARGSAHKAVAYAVEAAQQATAVLAYEDAVEHYERALQALNAMTEATPSSTGGTWQHDGQQLDQQRCDLLLALGEAQTRAGEVTRIRETFQQAADIARALHAPEQFARASLGVQAASWDFGGEEFDDVQLVNLLEEAAALLGSADSLLRAQVLARLARVPHRSISPERRVLLSRQAVAMACRLEDPRVRAIAQFSEVLALWGSLPAEQLLDAAVEVLRLCEAAADRGLALEGRILHLTALLEFGDMAAVDREIRAFARLAEEVRQPRYLWVAAWFQAMRSTLQGHFAEGERLAQEALAVGQRVHERHAEQVFGVQLFALRREQGRLGEIEPAVVGLAAQYPALAAWRCAVAWLYSELKREAQAREEFEYLSANRFTDIPSDLLWLPVVTMLSEVCAFLGDAARAEHLYQILLPHNRRNVILGAGGACLGSASRQLGLLARTMARWQEAEAHFEAALQFNTAIGARPAVVRTRYDYALALLRCGLPDGRQRAAHLLREALAESRQLGMCGLAGDIAHALKGNGATSARGAIDSSVHRAAAPREAIFRKEGEFWTIAYGDLVIRLRDCKGLHYLARLLVDPGRAIHASALIAGDNVLRRSGFKWEQPSVLAERAQVDGRRGLGDAGPILDATAKADYRRRLSDLRDELEEAERFNDTGRAAKARTEMNIVAQQLRAAVGLGGNDRRALSHAERARLTVTQCIKASLKKIYASDPALGQHFARAIKTGYFCSYTPDPAQPVHWKF